MFVILSRASRTINAKLPSSEHEANLVNLFCSEVNNFFLNCDFYFEINLFFLKGFKKNN